MATIRLFLAAMVVVCASPFVHCQGARQVTQQDPQQEEQREALRPWAPLDTDNASRMPDLVTGANGVSPLTSASPLAPSAISQVQGSFKIYPAVTGSKPLPTSGTWSVPGTPVLAFLPACTASKSSCFEVEYSVPSRNITCRWTVLFPPPTVVKGKQVQTPTVINEDANAAQYTMMVRLQAGMNYASVAMRPPVYPAAAAAKDWTGSVSLDIIVSPQGKVVSVPDVRGPAGLQPSAKLAVTKWVYGKTKVGGQDVARSFTVQVNYGVGSTVKPK